nr:hypothetical protein CFP56_65486 [Quercus suber]
MGQTVSPWDVDDDWSTSWWPDEASSTRLAAVVHDTAISFVCSNGLVSLLPGEMSIFQACIVLRTDLIRDGFPGSATHDIPLSSADRSFWISCGIPSKACEACRKRKSKVCPMLVASHGDNNPSTRFSYLVGALLNIGSATKGRSAVHNAAM